MFDVISVDFLTAAATSNWDIKSFLENSTKTLGDWFSLAVMLLGIIAIGLAVWQIVTGLMSHGRKQTNWAVSIILLLVGGALSTAGGWDLVKEVSSGGQKTIKDLGGQTIVLLQYGKLFLPW